MVEDTANLAALFPLGIAGLVFDCDGVMIDSHVANRYFYDSVLAYFGLPPMTRAQEDYAFMATTRQALMKMIPEKFHGDIEEAISRAIDYPRDVLPKTKLMPGFLAFVHKAHDLGLKLAIDTNRTQDGIQRILDFFSLPDYFDPVVSCTCCSPKPSPEGPLHICAAWKIEPEQALFIGDSVDDRGAAKGAGMRFAAFGAHAPTDVPAPDYAVLGASLWPFVRAESCPDITYEVQA